MSWLALIPVVIIVGVLIALVAIHISEKRQAEAKQSVQVSPLLFTSFQTRKDDTMRRMREVADEHRRTDVDRYQAGRDEEGA